MLSLMKARVLPDTESTGAARNGKIVHHYPDSFDHPDGGNGKIRATQPEGG